ncbi:hypothetical protein DFP72DRAFT_922804 [Ephemerocybe angulata]|uniref:Uncharacterized protein n=1 Tax=Ephemerocybe angulata TaxID=980116 RepID=A0A8H6HGP0_9AGAR|nr:hypothetical protein DFP72DRAFT_922804 [Tulosesus angulatus]
MSIDIPAHPIYSECVKNVAAACSSMDLYRDSQVSVDCVVLLSSGPLTAPTPAVTAQVDYRSEHQYPRPNLDGQAVQVVGEVGIISVQEIGAFEDEIGVDQ